MVMSIGPGHVELLVNGAVVRSLRPGQASPEGVKLVEIGPRSALIEVDGKRWQMALGSSTTSSVVLHADARGHFLATALINGVPVQALVDTGASSVALNLSDARRLGIDVAGARQIALHTAGGVRPGLRTRIARVQVGDIVLRDVEASVSIGNELPIVLLGMSFLNQLELTRSGSTLTLTRRH
jgi:aspartyl protease family protein